MSPRKLTVVVLALVASVLFLAGCSSDSSNLPTPPEKPVVYAAALAEPAHQKGPWKAEYCYQVMVTPPTQLSSGAVQWRLDPDQAGAQINAEGRDQTKACAIATPGFYRVLVSVRLPTGGTVSADGSLTTEE
jgi:hypothetical protein